MVKTNTVTVPAVERALSVLELVVQSNQGLSMSELSRRIDVPKSSLHLIMTTLEKRGYLQKNLHTRRYRFGLRIVSLSRRAIASLELREEAAPCLRALMQDTRLTVHMAVLELNEAVIVEKIEPLGSVRVATWIGRRMDVNCTAIGKALIAAHTETDIQHMFRTGGMVRRNEWTIISLKSLLRELEQVRKQGYSIDDEEDEMGFRCVGAPIFNSNRRVAAAISVSGTVDQIPFAALTALGRKVKQTAARISLRFRDSEPLL